MRAHESQDSEDELVTTYRSLEAVLLQHEIEQLLFRQAMALDERRYRDWLTFFTDDATYWMPIRSTRSRGEAAGEFTRPGEGAFFDETRALLEARVYKLETDFAWAEDPPSRTRHFVSNVIVVDSSTNMEVTASSNIAVFRSRLDVDDNVWVGRRVDSLRAESGQWKISRREIYLDHTVLKSKNLSTFF